MKIMSDRFLRGLVEGKTYQHQPEEVRSRVFHWERQGLVQFHSGYREVPLFGWYLTELGQTRITQFASQGLE